MVEDAFFSHEKISQVICQQLISQFYISTTMFFFSIWINLPQRRYLTPSEGFFFVIVVIIGKELLTFINAMK